MFFFYIKRSLPKFLPNFEKCSNEVVVDLKSDAVFEQHLQKSKDCADCNWFFRRM